ncbi:hypothetical protein C8R46DRAFT_48071 [Mycena filopes]|nr:hypothetical protein C8R46DRAFT_48071 [Mycena filopes]
MIPNEVYEKIFKFLDETDEFDATHCMQILSSLARVCRLFFAICIHRIYRRLEFSGSNLAQSKSPYDDFCGLLLHPNDLNGKPNPHAELATTIASCVKECAFIDWIPGRGSVPSTWVTEFLDRNCRAMRRMPNLVSLRLEETLIMKSLLFTISKLKTTLKTLSIRSCPLEAELTRQQLKDLIDLRLRTIEFFGASSLQPSVLWVGELEVFRTDSWEYGAHFLRRKCCALRVLELHAVEKVDLLFKRLEKCPAIEELVITDISLKLGVLIPTLSPGALLKIHTIHVPPSFLPSFAHRRLRKVVLLGTDLRDFIGYHEGLFHPPLPHLTATDLAPLFQSAAFITELHIPEHVYFVADLCKALKHLEVLVLSYAHPNYPTIPIVARTDLFRDTIHKLCTKWPPAPTLRELRLFFGADAGVDARPFMWDLQLQHQQLTGPVMSTAFPRLTTACVAARFVTWQRADDDTPWRAFVPHEFHGFVKNALASGRTHTDFGGCFEPFEFAYA